MTTPKGGGFLRFNKIRFCCFSFGESGILLQVIKSGEMKTCAVKEKAQKLVKDEILCCPFRVFQNDSCFERILVILILRK
jgi:hypothetical protein